MAPDKLRIGFVHPDLGIGGAERLVVDAAVALQRLGHDVVMFTSRHDPARCFEETRNGTLAVHVLGSSLPRSLHPRIPMTIVFSILRSILLSVLLWTSSILPPPASGLNPLSPLEKFDVFIVDQQSVCVPFLRFLTGTPVVFYCHFPDKLLSGGWEIEAAGSHGGGVALSRKTANVGLLKSVYRWPFDKLEEITTGQADIILSNSRFTSRVYARAFPSLAKRPPRVVYPCIDVDAYQGAAAVSRKGKGKAKVEDGVGLVLSDRPTIISFNRFEAKKNVALAIATFAQLKTPGLVPQATARDLRLVVGGGYDDQEADNRETLAALHSLCDSLSLSYHTLTSTSSPTPPSSVDVLFILNFSTAQRSTLLSSPHTLALLYTPTNEHFGIVPIEAMACGLPVLACNSGGPTETIVDFASVQQGGSDGSIYDVDTAPTGFLRPPKAADWAPALATLITLSDSERAAVSAAAKARVRAHFSSESLGRELQLACKEATAVGDLHTHMGDQLIRAGVTLMCVAAAGIALVVWLIQH